MSGLMDALACQNLDDDELEQSSMEEFEQWLNELTEEAMLARKREEEKECKNLKNP